MACSGTDLGFNLVYGLCPSSDILKNNNVLETGSLSVIRQNEGVEAPTLERGN
jgi:hypothetical protein